MFVSVFNYFLCGLDVSVSSLCSQTCLLSKKIVLTLRNVSRSSGIIISPLFDRVILSKLMYFMMDFI